MRYTTCMNTSDIGGSAEDLVVRHLLSIGHEFIAKNWKTKWCEIDVVTKKDTKVFFTEVKFRSSNDWGDGLSYITPKKVKQMHFAAENWLHYNNWNGDAQLLACSVNSSGEITLVDL